MTVPRKTFPDCPIERALAVLAGRWKARVVHQLRSGPARFKDLVARVPGIAERVLTTVLAELHQDGIVDKTENEWHLTELGGELADVLDAMFAWGEEHARRVPQR